MARIPLTRPVLERLADRFRALGECNRLTVLSVLRAGERTVSELMEETGLGQANLSKHLAVLHAQGFVARRREGIHVVYALADEDVFRICDILCSGLEREARDWSGVLQGAIGRVRGHGRTTNSAAARVRAAGAARSTGGAGKAAGSESKRTRRST
jgi:DNA-binding transcriptional ArsR family regulator